MPGSTWPTLGGNSGTGPGRCHFARGSDSHPTRRRTHEGVGCDQFDQPLEILEVPVSEPDADEDLVRIEASCLCHNHIHTAWCGTFVYCVRVWATWCEVQ